MTFTTRIGESRRSLDPLRSIAASPTQKIRTEGKLEVT
jgi:hypothetical protein